MSGKAFSILYIALALTMLCVIATPQGLSVTSLTLSNSVIDFGQTSTANSAVSEGVPPYSGIWTFFQQNFTGSKLTNSISVNNQPLAVAFNQQGTLAISTSQSTEDVSLIDVASNSSISSIQAGDTYGVAFGSGDLAYVTNQQGATVNVINVPTNSVVDTISVQAQPEGIAFNAHDNLLYVVNVGSGTVSAIDAATNSVVNTIDISYGNNPDGVAFNLQGTFAYVPASQYLSVIDVATNSVVDAINLGGSVTATCVAVNPQGTLAYVCDDEGYIDVVDLATNSVVNTIALASTPTGAAFSPSGALALVSMSGAGESVINVAANSTAGTINIGGEAYGVAFSPLGNLAYATYPSGDAVSVISPLETSVQSIPASNLFQLGIATTSSNTITFTFNGVSYIASAPSSNTIYGNLFVYGSVNDSSDPIALGNSLTIDPAPTLGAPVPSPSIIILGKSVDYSADSNGGTGPFTFNLLENGIVVNTISEPEGFSGTVTFGSVSPAAAGAHSFNVVGTDLGTTTPFVFNSVSNTLQVLPPLVSTQNTFTLSNTVIDLGQVSFANTLISGGSGSPYSGEWTFVPANNVNREVTSIPFGISQYGIAINPSGTLAYTPDGSTGLVYVVNLATNSVENTISTSGGVDIAFNPSGTLAYVTHSSGTVTAINVASNAVINSISVGGSDELYGVAFNPQGNLAYVVSYSIAQGVYAINVISNSVVNSATSGFSNPIGIALNPQGTLAYVTNTGGDTVSVVNLTTYTVVNTITVGSSPLGIALNPQGTLAYAVSAVTGGSVSVINLATNAVTNTIVIGGSSTPGYVTFNPSGTLAFVCSPQGGGLVSVINVATNTIIGTINVGGGAQDLAIAPNGGLLYVSNNQGTAGMNVISTSETNVQPIPSNNLLQLSIDPTSYNSITFGFNGVNYIETTGSANVFGPMNLYGFANDSLGPSDPSITVSNALTIDPAPSLGTPTPSSDPAYTGQNLVYTASFSGGAGPFTMNLLEDGSVVNTITEPVGFSGTVSISVTPSSTGSHTFNIIGTDLGTTTPFVFNSVSNTIQVLSSLVATPNPFAFSNSIIDVGQTTLANAVISGGLGSYSGSWTFLDSNVIFNNVVNSLPVSGIFGTPTSLAVNPLNNFVYVTTSNDAVEVISTTTNTVVNTITGITGSIGSITISPQGDRAYVSNSFDISVISLETNTIVATIPLTNGGNIDIFNPSGTEAYNIGGSSVGVIDVAANAVAGTLSGSGLGDAFSGAFNPQGTTAYITNFVFGLVDVVSAASNSVTDSLNVGSPTYVAFNPTGSTAYTSNQNGDELDIINVSTSSVVGFIPLGSLNEPAQLAMSPSGTIAYVTIAGTQLAAINLLTNSIIANVPFFLSGSYPAFNPQGTLVYAMSETSGEVGSILAPSTASETLTGGAFQLTATPINNTAISFNFGGTKYIGNTSSGYTVPGRLTLYGYVNDPMLMTNSLTIDPAPVLGAPTTNATTLYAGQMYTINTTFSGGTGPFVFNLTQDGSIVNTIYEPAGFSGRISFTLPSAGTGLLRLMVSGADLGTTTPYSFNSPNSTLVSYLLPEPNPFNITNTTIDVGQTSFANTLISEGSGQYYGQWTWLNSNEVMNNEFALINTGSQSVAFDPLASLAYLVNEASNNVSVVDTSTQTVTNSISVGVNPVFGVFSPINGTAYVLNNEFPGTISVINVSTNTVVDTISGIGTYPDGIAINPSGTLLYATSGQQNKLYVVSTSTDSIVNTIVFAPGSSPQAVAFSPYGNLAYVQMYGNSNVSIVNVSENTTIKNITIGGINLNYVSFNPQGTLAYVVAYGDPNPGEVNVISVQNSMLLEPSISVGLHPYTAVFNPSGSLAYVSNQFGSDIEVIDVANSVVISRFDVSGITNEQSIGINPNGTQLYSPYGQVALVGNLPESSVQALPDPPGGISPPMRMHIVTGILSLLINATSNNTVQFTFNGIRYNVSTGSKTLAGIWNLSGFAEDGLLPGSNTVLLYNSIRIGLKPVLGTPAPSNALIDFGQYETYNAEFTGGIGPFTFNLIENGIVVNTISEPAGFSGLITFNSMQPAPGTDTFSINGVDLGTTSPFPFNSVSNTLYVSTPIAILSSPFNAIVDDGQTVTYSATVYNGFGPFTVNLIENGAEIQSKNIASPGNSQTFSVAPDLIGLDTYNVIVTDRGATAPFIFNSLSNTVLRNSVPNVLFALAYPNIDLGQSETYVAQPLSGTGPFTVNFIYTNNDVVADTVNGVASGGTATYTFTPNSVGSYSLNVIATDQGSTTPYVSNTVTNTFTVGNAPTISFSVSNSAITLGSSTTFTATLNSGGLGPYLVNVTYSNGIVANSVSNVLVGNSVVFTLTPNTIGTYTLNAIVYDLGTGGVGGAWVATTPYPANTYGVEHCPISNGYEYCISGPNTNAVYYAPIAGLGVGAWQATTSLPVAQPDAACLNMGDSYVYCIGGQTSGTTVYIAPYLSPAPGIGAWQTTNSYPIPIYSVSCSSVAIETGNDLVFCVGGTNSISSQATNAVYFTTYPTSGGTLNSWQQTTSYPVPITGTKCTANPVGYIYCTGGYTSAGATAVSYYAMFNNSGIGAWQSTTSYPEAIGGEAGGTEGAYGPDFFFGGNSITSPVNYASLSSGGIGSYHALPFYPITGINDTSCPAESGTFECVGGEANGVATNAVYSLQSTLAIAEISGEANFSVTSNSASINVTTPAPTPTPPPSGGAGTGGGISSSGPQRPLITPYVDANCVGVQVSNLAQFNIFNTSVGGLPFTIVENFITPASAGVTINSQNYTLAPYQIQSLGASESLVYYAELTNVSYQPILHTITMNICSKPTGISAVTTNVTTPKSSSGIIISPSAPAILNYPSMGMGIIVTTNGSKYGTVNVQNLTSQASALPAIANGTADTQLIASININGQGVNGSYVQSIVNVTLHYNCSIPQSRLFLLMLVNGAWQNVTPAKIDPQTCTAQFQFAADPVIALGEYALPTTTTTSTTTTSTTVSTTTSLTVAELLTNPISIFIFVVLTMVLVAVVLYLAFERYEKKHPPRPPKNLPMVMPPAEPPAIRPNAQPPMVETAFIVTAGCALIVIMVAILEFVV